MADLGYKVIRLVKDASKKLIGSLSKANNNVQTLYFICRIFSGNRWK